MHGNPSFVLDGEPAEQAQWLQVVVGAKGRLAGFHEQSGKVPVAPGVQGIRATHGMRLMQTIVADFGSKGLVQ